MTPNEKREIIAILVAHRGDDLYRAQRAFAGTDLDKPWGESGASKREILEGCVVHSDKINRLISAVEAA